MPPIRDIVGYCPMGCGPHLHLMSGGMIMCLATGCPEPGAVTRMLSLPPEKAEVTGPLYLLPLSDPRHRCVQGLCDDHAGLR